MSPSPENPISGKGVHGMAVNPKREGEWNPHPVTNTGANVLHPPIPFPETAKRFGDARDDVFYQPARPVPVERPVKVEVNPEKLSLISRLAIVLGSLAIAGGAGLTIQHQIENQETLHPPSIGNSLGAIPQTAEKDYHLLLQKLGAEIVVPTVVDRKATQGVIGPANSVLITAQEYEKVAPPVIEKDNVNLLFPIKSRDGQAPTVEYKLNTFSGPRSVGREGKVQEQVTVNDAVVISGLKPGDILISPITGKIDGDRSEDSINPDRSVGSFFINGVDKDGNGLTFIISTVNIKLLMAMPKTKGGADQPTADIKAGDSIAEILTSSNHQFYRGQVQIWATSRVRENDGTSRWGPANINIPTNPDQKAFVLQ